METDSLSLHGKIAIVTGSGRENGIGAAIAITLARHGAAVTIHYVSDSVTERAQVVAKGIRADGGKAAVVQASIETPEGAQYLVDETLRVFHTDRIDILINNAGVPLFGETMAVTPKQLTGVLDVNVKGPIFVAQAVVPVIAPGGRIVNISSIASKLGDNFIPIYGASKAALDSLTWSWAKERDKWGRSKGITVNAVAPGPVLTDAIPAAIADEFQRPSIEMTRAADRAGTAVDVADAVLLLVSEKARWITGQSAGGVCESSLASSNTSSPGPGTPKTSWAFRYPMSSRTSNVLHFSVEQEAPVCKLMRELCFALAFADDSAMHLVLARLEIDPERTGGWASQESASSLTHYNASIEILRNQIDGAQLMAHEAIIGVVVNLACYDIFTNNLARWKTHMSGLQKMIEYRGGISTLSSQYLQVTTIWMDLTGSMILDQPPHFTLYQADSSMVRCIRPNLEDEAMDVVHWIHRDTELLLQLLLELSNLAAGRSELELSEDSALLQELQAAVYTTLTLPRYKSPDIYQNSLAPRLLTYEIFRLAVLVYLSGPVTFLAGSTDLIGRV
ncbi:3-oxoacyl-acyl-carrierreductase [Fusarium acutatum]|uniref:3-oxoacyl-acyl-carrierreductase n=1 Tax=Fusarium acutatum TaxID=78861 RepID=A0A8H4JQ72_9HYPO|nr:3-oxoacyl-acyl-carrierreductase [Fusarium acutatum]